MLYSRAKLAALLALTCLCAGCTSVRHASNVGRDDEPTITLWHPWGGIQKEKLSQVVAAFNKSGAGFRVREVFVPNDLGSCQKFFTAVAAGKPPDAVFVDGPQTAAWAEQGALAPLDVYVRRDGIKPEDFFTPCWVQNEYKGSVWAMTYCADPNFALIWNKKVFREVGLDPEKPPTTMEELDKYNELVTKRTGGKIVRFGIVPWGQYGGANSLYTWGWAFGGSFYDPRTRTVTADNARVVKALEWMASYAKKYDVRKISAFTAGFGSREQNPLYTGEVVMRCMHIGDFEEIGQYAPNLDYGLGYIPAPAGGEEHSSWVGGWCMAIPRGSRHPAMAWKFIKWCCASPEGTEAMGRLQGLLPGYKKSPYLAEARRKPGCSQFLRILEECRHQRPVMPAQAFYMDSLTKAVDYVTYGQMTPKEALAKARAETQAELNLRIAGG